MAFRFLRLATDAAKSATPPLLPLNMLLPPRPFFADTELVAPSPVRAPVPVAVTRRASGSKAVKKTTRDQKRSKKRAASRR